MISLCTEDYKYHFFQKDISLCENMYLCSVFVFFNRISKKFLLSLLIFCNVYFIKNVISLDFCVLIIAQALTQARMDEQTFLIIK